MSIRDQLAHTLKARRSVLQMESDEDIYNDPGFDADEFDDDETPVKPSESDSDREDYEEPEVADPANVAANAQIPKFYGRPPPMVPPVFLQQHNTAANEPPVPPLPGRRRPPPCVPDEPQSPVSRAPPPIPPSQEPPVSRAPPSGPRNKEPPVSRAPPSGPRNKVPSSRPPPPLPVNQDELTRGPVQPPRQPPLPQEDHNQWQNDEDVYLAPSTTQDQEDQYLAAADVLEEQEETEYLAPSETPPPLKLFSRQPQPAATRDSIQSQHSYRSSVSSNASDYSSAPPAVPKKTNESFQAPPMLPPNHPSTLKDSKTTSLPGRGRNLPQIPTEQSQASYELLPNPPAQPKAAERAILSPRNDKKPWQFSKKKKVPTATLR